MSTKQDRSTPLVPPEEGPWVLSSDQARFHFAQVLLYCRIGGTVIVTHYNRPIVQIGPYESVTDAR